MTDSGIPTGPVPSGAADGDADADGRIARMTDAAAEAAGFLKALAHEGRLLILCHLVGGERTVGQLETLLGQRQAAVSQQLARLRADGLVASRRDGKARLYSIADPRVEQLVGTLYALFCADA